MATNVTVFPVEGPAVVYFQDGSSIVVEAQQTWALQLPEGGFCTISDSPAAEQLTGEAFVEMMVKFWQGMWDKIKAEATEPEVNPL